jgi:hypothetical protein
VINQVAQAYLFKKSWWYKTHQKQHNSFNNLKIHC